jgi:quercetin dioxygenase-like cupin family protein
MMETDTITKKKSFTGNRTSFISSAQVYDLPALILNMKNNPEWESGELNALILLNNSNKKVVLTVMHDRTEVSSFQSGDSVTFQVIEGRMKFHTSIETVILGKGQLLSLHDKTKFSMTTLEESAFLLTILTGSLKSIQD